MRYERFSKPRPIAEYAGVAGPELGGRALPPSAYEALAEARTSGRTCELVAVGAHHDDLGRTWLDLAVTRGYIESTTNWRQTDRGLLWTCPECGLRSGKHTKSCDYQ